jgi:site-specific DNA-methyltransferase (adenine-specific)
MLDEMSGGASRFFYVAKPSKAERNAGCDELEEKTVRTGCHGEMPIDDDGKERDRFSKSAKNTHPTVKPIKLMQYFCKLVTPIGGTILDCFAGSGTTLVAAEMNEFKTVAMELEPQHCDIILARLEHVTGNKAELS